MRVSRQERDMTDQTEMPEITQSVIIAGVCALWAVDRPSRSDTDLVVAIYTAMRRAELTP